MGQQILSNKTKRKGSDNTLTNSSNQIPFFASTQTKYPIIAYATEQHPAENLLEREYVQKELYIPKSTGVSSVWSFPSEFIIKM